MSWRDRPYAEDGGDYAWSGTGPGVTFGLPRPTQVVKVLLIVNIGVFVLMALSQSLAAVLEQHFAMAVWGGTASSGGVLNGHIWRLMTYQYLHDTRSLWHILFNMIGLYFLGPPLERRWGSKTFFLFYTACGVAGALLFTLLVGIGAIGGGIMVGASGSVLGLLAGCAVLLPQMTIILLFFPVPIRFAAILLAAVYTFSLLVAYGNQSGGVGGDAAHLGGMLFGGAWCIWGWTWLGNIREKRSRGAWERKMRHQQNLQAEVDRILAKVHEHGIQSLTRREKRTLSEATEQQREQEHRTRHRT